MRWIRMRHAAVAVLVGVGVLVPTGQAQAAPLDDAVASGVAQAAARGVTSYVSVVDRRTGQVVSETANAHTQVASESVMKLFLAAYYAVQAGGSGNLSASRAGQLSTMIRYSDDGIASAVFTSAAIPSVAARYGLGETANAGNPGRWGAARITAHDTAKFLYAMSVDPAVGPWLMGLMAQTAPNGSDGFDQSFGFNALSGDHGSKQGWGSDNWTAQANAVHSVGYTDQWFGAILQTGGSGTYRLMRDTATTTARLIQAAPRIADDPVGRIDGAALNGFDLTVNGWAFDPNQADQPLRIDLYDQHSDGSLVGYGGATAVATRPDVAAAYPGAGPNQGWSGTLRLIGGGSHWVCAYGIGVAAGGNTELGCVTVQTPVPVGTLDDAANTAPGQLTVRGWSFDPEVPTTAGATHVYVTAPDGSVAGTALTADGSRPDVAAVFPGVGDRHGFSAQLGVGQTGTYQVCAYAISVAPPALNPGIGCAPVSVQNSFGALDTVTASAGRVQLTGWAINPNNTGQAVEIHVYDTVAGATAGTSGNRAGGDRPDVAAVFGQGAAHGFGIDLPAAPGDHQVCAFALTTGGGVANTLLGCRTVTVPVG